VDRYESVLCQENPFPKEFVRYIDLNPLPAGLVADCKSLQAFADRDHCLLARKCVHDWQITHSPSGKGCQILICDQSVFLIKNQDTAPSLRPHLCHITDLSGTSDVFKSRWKWFEISALKQNYGCCFLTK
jgi:hypothetical protein